ncbi:hypothetical protein CCAND38_380006 [Capnocytophaga canis]|uniref:Uncharacterized protein n=2 Tax=Capnocytophaga TaxID=1016 RepID=A0A0B7HP96_9FLAO|nr:hypothetical protein CCYN2B_80002 [Capnocytophaga cynodegmi]CEN41444.1 hypothetical protein CCYN49044_500006 [Capnocytophaga cynodegmi]CEN46826.1 hypothetical protein CCAND38_380006 [Capnocytophaga canis]
MFLNDLQIHFFIQDSKMQHSCLFLTNFLQCQNVNNRNFVKNLIAYIVYV